MTIPFTGTGGFFTRVGLEAGTIAAINTHRGTTIGGAVTNIHDEYLAEDQELVDTLYLQRDAYREITNTLATYLQGVAQSTLIEMVKDDVNLGDESLTAAMEELVRQMIAETETVEKPTVSATASAAAGNTGNGKCLVSIVNQYGIDMDYIFNESIRATVTSDEQLGATLNQEPVQIVGEAAAADPLREDYPAGSGANLTTSVLDPSDSGGLNLLTNGDWALFTGQSPDNWTTEIGSDATRGDGAGNGYRLTSALKIIGNGSELTSLVQPFDDAGGTPTQLAPNTVYAVSFWTKVDSVPAAGVLRVALVNGSGTVINDDAGTANSTTVSLPGETTTYAHHYAFFRTPKNLPAIVQLQVKLTTALTNARIVYISDLMLAEATQAYSGGPFVAIIPGSTRFILNDYFTIAASNDYGSLWQLWIERLFGMRDMGLQLPSTTGAETILDSLITT